MSARDVKYPGKSKDIRSLQLGEFPVVPSSTIHKTKELGEVLGYDAAAGTYIVATHGAPGEKRQPGGKIISGIGRKVDQPGTETALAVGTKVVIEWALGFPYIDGVLYIDAIPSTAQVPNVGTKKTSPIANMVIPPDNTSQTSMGCYLQPGAPTDLLEGDKIMFTEDGNRILVGRGNYNVMDAGPGCKAKVETFGKNDLVRTTCENLDIFTGFGILNVYNDGGRCGLQFRAAADQLNESGGKEEQWTFKLDIGETGDYFNMEVCGSDGLTKSKFQITPGGRVTLLSTDGLDLINGGETPSHEEHVGDVFKKFGSKLATWVKGAITETFLGARSTKISESDSKIVGYDESTFINHNRVENVGGNVDEVVTGGSMALAKPTNIAVKQQALNGSWLVDIGNPKAGASPAAMAGYSLYIHNGKIVLGEDPLMPAARASVSLNTLKPDSIALGGTIETSMFHAMLYEKFEIFMTQFLAQFDTHSHPPMSPPVVPLSPMLTPMLQLMKSIRVKIGL